MRKSVLSLLLLFLMGGASAQMESLSALEDSIAHTHQRMLAAGDDNLRFAINDSLRLLIIEVLNSEGCFAYPFKKLTNMGTITSPDKAFRVFNWNVARENETHKYFCFILTADPKTQTYNWTELLDQERTIDKPESRYLAEDNWFGCLYYEIIPVKKRKKVDYYVMLGWDGNDRFTTKKVIDALSFEKNGIRMGAPVFKAEKSTLKRVVLEYSSDVMVSVKYHSDMKSIVFDHLAPGDPAMVGVYAMYGPDLSFDSYKLKKGKWELQSNIDIRLERKDSRPYNDPGR
ncbi:MAG: hypothetical protein KDC12_15490 [Flavobacteriales bacterium]|nr:hypothetical protein [Flavobacteriales bacterium]